MFAKRLIFFIGLSISSLAWSGNYEDHQSIRFKVADYIDQMEIAGASKKEINISNIDPRIRLAKCSQDLELKLTGTVLKPGKNTVSVSCHSAQAWRVFVSAEVHYLTEALFVKTHLTKGQHISNNDVELKPYKITRQRLQYMNDKRLALGKEVRRNLKAGDLLTTHVLKDPIAIKRGDTVSIVAVNTNFQISMKGKALSNGVIGKKIRIKNLKTDKVIQGIVFDKQTVKVSI